MMMQFFVLIGHWDYFSFLTLNENYYIFKK